MGTPLPVIVLCGPTAAGKTALAFRLWAPETGAPLFPAEIISADSMQVYRGLDIGTAKPDAPVRSVLPHHLLDIRNPDEQFSAGDFLDCADQAVLDISSRGKIPVVLGGTGFYIRQFLFGLPVTPPSDPVLRESIQQRFRLEGAEPLRAELADCDPVSYSRIHPNDIYRITRALEVFGASGRPLSSFERATTVRPGIRPLVIGIDRPREQLRELIHQRVAQMMTAGLYREFRQLLDSGYGPETAALSAIGYREFFETGETEAPWGKTASLIEKNTRLYAKRQQTFFRALPLVEWYSAGDYDGVCDRIRSFIDSCIAT